MPKVQIFITTHNRPHFIFKSVNSVLNQTFTDFSLIISDNSTNDLTNDQFKRINDSRVSYIKREPQLSNLAHFNVILSEVSSDYFMIFHDDDLMLFGMIEKLIKEFEYNENAIAVGGNAFFIYNFGKTNKLIFKSNKSRLVLKNSLEVARQYLIRNGIVPFSSFLYKNEVAKKVRFNSESGQNFFDAAFMMDIAKIGNLVYLNVPVMEYFVHTENDHVPDTFTNNMKFINFIKKTTDKFENVQLVKEYRIKAIYMELKQGLLTRRIKIGSSRYIKLLKILFNISFNDFFPRILIITLMIYFKVSSKKIIVDA